MRDVPASMQKIWASGDYIGPNKPIARVTLQRPQNDLRTYNVTSAYQGYEPSATGVADVSTGSPITYLPKGKSITEVYSNFLLGNDFTPKEMRNIRSVSWSRDGSADVAECTVEIYNSARRSDGVQIPGVVDIDQPGFYSYNRGSAYFASRWADHSTNEWANLVMPDNIIRTYEGYGVDWDLAPEKDPHLVLTGTWMIDSVQMTADGIMTLSCRDVGRLLLDQYIFPPVVPNDFYPLSFEAWPEDPVQVGEIVGGVGTGTGPYRFIDTGSLVQLMQSATDLNGLSGALNQLGSLIGATVRVATTGGNEGFPYAAVRPEQFETIKSAAITLANEVGKYPNQFFMDCNFDRLYLTGTINNGSGIAAFAYQGGVWIDVAYDFAGVFHHEFAHIWHFTYYDWFNANIRGRWEALNPGGYGNVPNDRPAGYMTPYARTSIEEDVADTMRWMMTDGEYQIATGNILPTDNVVKAKVALLREMLRFISKGGTGNYPVDMGADDFFFNVVVGPTQGGGKVTQTETSRVQLTPELSSNIYWNPPGSNPNAALGGHYLRDAFDDNNASYWLSIGNIAPSRKFAFEYIQATVPNTTVTQFRFAAFKTGYTAFAHVMVNGVWQGEHTVNYSRDGVGKNDSNIKFVASCPVSSEGLITLDVGKWENVQRVRLTFGSLQYIKVGSSGNQYRAGIRTFKVYNTSVPAVTRTGIFALLTGPEGANPGFYRNYTNIVKLLLAWGGWLWPEDGFIKRSDGTSSILKFTPPDEIEDVLGLTNARVWGDFQQTATAGPAAITEENWDKKTLMDGIRYCAEITGALFYIDESGAANFRLPNIYEAGNYRNGLSANPGRTNEHYIIDERHVLMSLTSTISSANVREGVYVSNSTGDVAAVVGGYNPNPTGIRRWGGWTDENFEDQAEVERMADMIVIRQLMTYRQDTLTIPAMPGIQVDDQIRVNERVTSEGYLHYVKTIRSTNNLEDGTWTYEMTTNWLGDTAGADVANPDPNAIVVVRRPRTLNSAGEDTGESGALISGGDITSSDRWLFRLEDLSETTNESIRNQLAAENYENNERTTDG